MQVEKKDLEKSQVELVVTLDEKEFEPYVVEGAKELSREVKIDGFRSGKIPFDILKQKVGEMPILEKAARLAINKSFEEIIKNNLDGRQPIGQPRVDIVKLAPNNPVEFKILVAILPKVTLGKYKDLKVKEEKVVVSEEDIKKTINNLLEGRAKETLADREVKDTDKVVLDLEMFLDKVPLDGGQSKGVTVVVGKEVFIPGFDKQLLGLKKGDVKEFKLPYPEDFHQKHLAGKMVEFKASIVDVFARELAKPDDEFAKTLGLKNFAELEKHIKEGMEAEKQQEANRKTEIKIIDGILKEADFSDIPDVLIENESKTMLGELEQNITGQGGKFDDYLSSIKKTREELLLDLTPDAVKRIKSALAIRTIAETEKIKITEEEIDKKRDALLEQYKGYEKVAEKVSSQDYRGVLHNILSNQKVMEQLKEWNIA